MHIIWKTFLAAYEPRNALDFKGKATLPEFWYFVLGVFAVQAIAQIVFFAAGFLGIPLFRESANYEALDFLATMFGSPFIGALNVFLLLSIVPGLSMSVRRFRDAGVRGWAGALLLFMAAASVVLAFLCLIYGMSYTPVPSPYKEWLEPAFIVFVLDAMILFIAIVFILASPSDTYGKRL